MKWGCRIEEYPKVRVRRVFAWWPIRCAGVAYWLQRVWVLEYTCLGLSWVRDAASESEDALRWKRMILEGTLGVKNVG